MGNIVSECKRCRRRRQPQETKPNTEVRQNSLEDGQDTESLRRRKRVVQPKEETPNALPQDSTDIGQRRAEQTKPERHDGTPVSSNRTEVSTPPPTSILSSSLEVEQSSESTSEISNISRSDEQPEVGALDTTVVSTDTDPLSTNSSPSAQDDEKTTDAVVTSTDTEPTESTEPAVEFTLSTAATESTEFTESAGSTESARSTESAGSTELSESETQGSHAKDGAEVAEVAEEHPEITEESDEAGRSTARIEEIVEKSQSKALQKKDEGNAFFGKGAYREAIDCYTEAIAVSPDEDTENQAVYFCNRAACYTMTAKAAGNASAEKAGWEDTVADCTAALRIKPAYAKALVRRAQAHEKLDQIVEAFADYKACVEADPTNRGAAESMMRIKPETERRQQQQKDEMIDKLKGLADGILGKFGMSVNDFKTTKNPDGNMSISYQPAGRAPAPPS